MAQNILQGKQLLAGDDEPDVLEILEEDSWGNFFGKQGTRLCL